MKFKNNNQAKLIINNYANNEIDNVKIEQYLDDCANTINDNSFDNFSIDELNRILKIILGHNFKKLYTIFYSESIHNYVLKIIDKELDKLNDLDNNFYKYYTSKLNSDYLDYYIPYKVYDYHKQLINDYGVNKAYEILTQIAEFKDVIQFNI